MVRVEASSFTANSVIPAGIPFCFPLFSFAVSSLEQLANVNRAKTGKAHKF